MQSLCVFRSLNCYESLGLKLQLAISVKVATFSLKRLVRSTVEGAVTHITVQRTKKHKETASTHQISVRGSKSACYNIIWRTCNYWTFDPVARSSSGGDQGVRIYSIDSHLETIVMNCEVNIHNAHNKNNKNVTHKLTLNSH